MLSDHISKLFIKAIKFAPTESQLKLIEGFGSFLMSTESNRLLLVKGYAGTGKTWVMSAIVQVLKELNINVVLMAPTGRAAKVLSVYSNSPAYTIHKVIYRQQGSGTGSFNLNWNKYRDTLFIVDEASMISNSSNEYSMFGSGRLLDDLFEFIQQGANCKLVLVGDTAQLPPVGLDQSPALDVQLLNYMGYEVDEFFLNDVIRQEQKSGILQNATSFRNALESDIINIPKIIVKSFTDVECINGEVLIDKISNCYDFYGEDNTIIICRSNKRASLFNKGIRNSILYREEELIPGDYLMVIKNNYFWTEKVKDIDFIANGDIAKVVRISGYEELYGLRFANVTLCFPDYEFLELDVKIILDILLVETAGFTREQSEAFYNEVIQDYADIKSKKNQFDELRKNPYFNAVQVKYGYAVTCHKAQGGQWPAVFVDQGYVSDDDKKEGYLRWLYTAITRATEKLFFVNFPDSQIENG
ncbi:MAG: AAA family ATPase [Marinilabiliaceae bacterium]|nr:AAA family ATPase [Marinilabiliaceae bacterium]